jgi:predicted RNA-binding Zn-ribbon protein involved in translation (DUF1610 family)
MGQICLAQCSCGFHEEVTVGGGMSDFEKRSYFPHYCSQCGLVTVNVRNQNIKCPKCGGNVIAYGDKLMMQGSRWWQFRVLRLKRSSLYSEIQWGKYRIPASGNLCPQCQQFTMVFHVSVMFD